MTTKTYSLHLKRNITFALLAVCIMMPHVSAQTLTWNGAANTTWSTSAANWTDGTSTLAWVANRDAVFNTAIATLTTSGTITCNSITVNESVTCNKLNTPSFVGGATGEVCTITVASGKVFKFGNTPIKTTTTLVKEGDGEFIPNSALAIIMNAGTIQGIATGSLGKTFSMYGGILTSNSSNKSPDNTTTFNIAGNITIGSATSSNGSTANCGLTFSASLGGINLTDANRTITLGGSGTQTFSGKITSTTPSLGALTIAGTGKLLISNTANDYTGGTTINGGTLILGASEVLTNAGAVTLGGGTLKTGATVGFSETINTLRLTENSTIALGTGVHTLTIANSSAQAWTVEKTLTITGWTGTSGASGTASGGKIIVGVGGLTAGQLAQISFTGHNNGAMITASGELVPNFSIQNNSITANISSLSLNSNYDLTVANGGDLTVDASATVHSLTVAVGGKLNIDNAATLTGTLTLQSTTDGTATLVDNYATPTQAAVVQQHVDAGRNWYISSPIHEADYSQISGCDSVVSFNEVTKKWVKIESGNLIAGKGYIRAAASGQGTTGTVNFSGLTNSGDISVVLTRTGTTQAGFNLVGNPYPSYLDWSMVAPANTNVMSTAWFRTKKMILAGGGYTFATVNVATPSDPTIVENDANTTITKYIPPMQAYWVRLIESPLTTNYTVTNNMRAHADNAGNKMKAPKQSDKKLVRLRVSNGVNSDETVVYFHPNAVNEYDNFDSPKMSNNSVSIPEIYTQVGSEKLVINGLKELNNDTEISLGFTTGQANNFSISTTELTNFETGTHVILKDKLRKTETELNEGISYSFDAPVTAANTDRFSVLFRAPGVATGVNTTTKLNAQVIVNQANQIMIHAPEYTKVIIYNALGQKQYETISTATKTTINSSFKVGVYFVELSIGNKSQVQKVVIR